MTKQISCTGNPWNHQCQLRHKECHDNAKCYYSFQKANKQTNDITLFKTRFIQAIRLTNTFLALLQILSIGILGMGIWLAVMDFSQFMDAAQSTDKDVVFDGAQEVGPFLLKVIGYVLIATGSIAIVIAFLGCCGALRESQCMLTTVRCSQLCCLCEHSLLCSY